MKRLILNRGEENRIKAGHPWVFDNEVQKVLLSKGDESNLAELEAGETADIESCRKEYLGRAFINPNSKIIARIYSRSKEGVDTGFFKQRIRRAMEERTSFDLNIESARLVFAEADGLPGLVIDKYTGWSCENIFALDGVCFPLMFNAIKERLGTPVYWLSIQILTYGMEVRRQYIFDALDEVFPDCKGIIEKSSATVREKEGLSPSEGIIKGDFPAGGIIIFENGFPFIVDLPKGQKTGHFLDQKENHLRAGIMAVETTKIFNRKIKVLDAFCYSGGFAVHICRMADAGVTAVDTSKTALDMVRQNARLNASEDNITTVEANVFDYLTAKERSKEHFDLIVLDPPAFVKNQASLEAAIRGYKEINLKAIKLLSPNGILITFSCSYAMTETLFKKMIADAAYDAERRLTQIDFCYQSKDHPILIGYGESAYLKCGCYRVKKI